MVIPTGVKVISGNNPKDATPTDFRSVKPIRHESQVSPAPLCLTPEIQRRLTEIECHGEET